MKTVNFIITENVESGIDLKAISELKAKLWAVENLRDANKELCQGIALINSFIAQKILFERPAKYVLCWEIEKESIKKLVDKIQQTLEIGNYYIDILSIIYSQRKQADYDFYININDLL